MPASYSTVQYNDAQSQAHRHPTTYNGSRGPIYKLTSKQASKRRGRWARRGRWRRLERIEKTCDLVPHRISCYPQEPSFPRRSPFRYGLLAVRCSLFAIPSGRPLVTLQSNTSEHHLSSICSSRRPSLVNASTVQHSTVPTYSHSTVQSQALKWPQNAGGPGGHAA